MSSNPPIDPPPDPLLCCAARVCCHGVRARQATAKILYNMGLTQLMADSVALRMEQDGIVLMPISVSRSMRDLVGSSKEYWASSEKERSQDLLDKQIDI